MKLHNDKIAGGFLMPGKILIVDSVSTNRIVLKVKLSSAFYEVVQAASAKEAIDAIRADLPDLILLSVDLPDDDGLRLCGMIKTSPETRDIPIVLLSPKSDRDIRMAALKAGADDVLGKPVDDLVMLARLRSLLRARDTADEMRLREGTARVLGFAEDMRVFANQARVLIVSRDRQALRRWSALLKPIVPFGITTEITGEALRGMSKNPVPDVFVIALDRTTPDDGLRLLAEIRARSTTRHAGILVMLSGGGQRDALVDALDLGANDVMADGFDPEELALRVSTQIQHKRMADRLRENVRDGLRAAVIDPLTGLFNRRYAIPHLARIAEHAQTHGRNFAVMVADLDHFKQINDNYGHAAGDAVLVEVARRLRDNLRASDLVARIGGEEFLIAMPDTTRQEAQAAAGRLCETIRDIPVRIAERDLQLPITVSIGLVMGKDCAGVPDRAAAALLDRADQALYGSKSHGRDQVTLSLPAA